MPIYEYKCQNCNKKFDKLQTIHEKPLTQCIYCKGTVNKLISSSSFTFKGNGWYITDYKKKNKSEKKSTNNESK